MELNLSYKAQSFALIYFSLCFTSFEYSSVCMPVRTCIQSKICEIVSLLLKHNPYVNKRLYLINMKLESKEFVKTVCWVGDHADYQRVKFFNNMTLD